jgi:twitching motility protein PilT
MVAAYEFMVVTPAIANLIRENKTFRIDSSIQTGKKYGMQLLDEHLLSLYMSNAISEEEAMDKARHPGEMQDKIEAHKRGTAPPPSGGSGRLAGPKETDGGDGEPPPQIKT